MAFSVGIAASPSPAVAAEADFSWQADFELPEFFPGSVAGQAGWEVKQGGTEVVPGIGVDGSSGLRVEAASPFSQARLTLSRTPESGPVVFYDFLVRLAAAPWLVTDETFDIDGARIGLFSTASWTGEAEWWVFHGDGSGSGYWMDTGETVPLDPESGLTSRHIRLTVGLDSDAAAWSFWVDGRSLASGLGLQEAPPSDHTSFIALGDPDYPVLIDDLRVSAFDPLGADAERIPEPPARPAEELDLTDRDADGLPDSWELAHGYDPDDPADAVSDRDGDGLTTLDEYLQGTETMPSVMCRAGSFRPGRSCSTVSPARRSGARSLANKQRFHSGVWKDGPTAPEFHHLSLSPLSP